MQPSKGEMGWRRGSAAWADGVGRQREPMAWVGSVRVGWQWWEEVERELRELRERGENWEFWTEKEKQINNILIGSENKKLFYFLALSYSAHP